MICSNFIPSPPPATINDFIAGFQELLKPEGTITIEFPHVLKMFENNEFDTIYHEHFFYFSIYSLKTILFKHQLSIYDIDELDTHGGSLRVYVTHLGNSIDLNSDKSIVDNVLSKTQRSDACTNDGEKERKNIIKRMSRDYTLEFNDTNIMNDAL